MTRFIEQVSCPLPTSGRTEGIWLEVCNETPCNFSQWYFPNQVVDSNTDNLVVVHILNQAGPIQEMRCVNLDTEWARYSITQKDIDEVTYLPEASGLIPALILLAIIGFRRAFSSGR